MAHSRNLMLSFDRALQFFQALIGQLCYVRSKVSGALPIDPIEQQLITTDNKLHLQ